MRGWQSKWESRQPCNCEILYPPELVLKNVHDALAERMRVIFARLNEELRARLQQFSQLRGLGNALNEGGRLIEFNANQLDTTPVLRNSAALVNGAFIEREKTGTGYNQSNVGAASKAICERHPNSQMFSQVVNNWMDAHLLLVIENINCLLRLLSENNDLELERVVTMASPRMTDAADVRETLERIMRDHSAQ